MVADDLLGIDLYKDKLSYKAVRNRVVTAIYRNVEYLSALGSAVLAVSYLGICGSR